MEKNIGKVIQIIGPVIDIRFENGHLPDLLNAIEIEHEGKTKVIKDNIITDLPKAEPWMISLVKLCYEYFVYGANKIFGKKAAYLNAKHNDIDNDIDSGSKQKKMMYKNIYEALPQSFSREQLVDVVITNFGKTKKTVENIVTNWNKNQVWKFDDATKLFSKI